MKTSGQTQQSLGGRAFQSISKTGAVQGGFHLPHAHIMGGLWPIEHSQKSQQSWLDVQAEKQAQTAVLLKDNIYTAILELGNT